HNEVEEVPAIAVGEPYYYNAGLDILKPDDGAGNSGIAGIGCNALDSTARFLGDQSTCAAHCRRGDRAAQSHAPIPGEGHAFPPPGRSISYLCKTVVKDPGCVYQGKVEMLPFA